MSSDQKNIYKKLCSQNKEIPLFLQYNWVNTIYNNWEIALYYKADDCYAFMIFPITHKKGFSLIHIPPLSPFQGFYIHYPKGQKEHTKISFEHEVFQYFIENMPHFDWLKQKLPYGFTNFLQFYWNGFKITPKITYELDLANQTEDELWQNLKESLRRNIKKAEKQLSVISSTEVNSLYNLKVKRSKIEPVNYSADYLNKINIATKNNNLLYYAVDESNKTIAGTLIVYDKSTAYYLLGSVDDEFKNTGALSLLLWRSIKESKKMNISHFNFEGSMIQPIERFFSSFGAKQKIYFEIEKIKNPILKLKNKIL
jgi:hypothetical protein